MQSLLAVLTHEMAHVFCIALSENTLSVFWGVNQKLRTLGTVMPGRWCNVITGVARAIERVLSWSPDFGISRSLAMEIDRGFSITDE
jgi:hypothetical protein